MNPESLIAHFEKIINAPTAIPRLRRFVFDLSLRGKLVPQDASNESASDLLESIRRQKAEWVKDNKIRPQPHLPAITEKEFPFALPHGWLWARLGEVIHLVSGQHLQPGEYSDQKEAGIPYITGPADFGNNGLVITRYAIVKKATAKQGQLLLTVKGAGVGKTAICNLPEVAISRQLMALTAIGWNKDFLELTTHRLAVALVDSARSLIPGISRVDVDRFIFGLPPLLEQARIVAKVDELMSLCDQLEAQLATAEMGRERLLEAILTEALNDKPEMIRALKVGNG